MTGTKSIDPILLAICFLLAARANQFGRRQQDIQAAVAILKQLLNQKEG
jgi:hypothetical protein